MGRHAWRATCIALEIRNAPQAIGKVAGAEWDADGIKVFAVGHCGPLGLKNRRLPTQENDWARIGDALRRIVQMSENADSGSSVR
jgi:hypothetical protein